MAEAAASSSSSTSPSLTEVFDKIEKNFQHTSLGPDRWYLLATACLAGGNDPDLCADLYDHLIAKPEFSTPTQRQALIRRIREVLIKCISIVGVCKPLEAIMAINEREREEDKDRTCTREGWQCDEKSLERGMDWMRKLYTRNTDSTLGFYTDHPDFQWISKRITYGLYLSDRQVLDDIDTEMVVLPGIMIQNLPKETHWHIRGTRRIGVSKEDVQQVWDSVQLVAAHLGVRLHRVPTVDEVESDV